MFTHGGSRTRGQEQVVILRPAPMNGCGGICEYPAIFPVHFVTDFEEPNLARCNILQQLSVQSFCRSNANASFRLLPAKCCSSLVERNARGQRWRWIIPCLRFEHRGVGLLNIELEQGGSVPLAHLISLRTKVVQDSFDRS
jgi:hypothetical protein